MAAKFAVTGDQFVVIDDRMREVKRQLRLKGGSPLDPERVAEALQRIVEGRCEVIAAGDGSATEAAPLYPITVDYGMTLAEMIAAGRYDSQNSDINTQNFPITGEGQVDRELHLVHPNKVASTEEVLAKLDRLGLRPAKIEELLAFGAKYPNLQKKFPVVTLGSVWQHPSGGRHVAYLAGWYGERDLDLLWIGSDWDEYFRFAAVSK